MSGNYQQMLMNRLVSGKRENKLIQDHQYVEFLEGQLKKKEVGIFLFDALGEKLKLMEGSIEILEKKVQNWGQSQQNSNEKQQEMINSCSSEQLNYIHQIYRDLNGKIDAIGMGIKQGQQEKLDYDKVIEERVNYIVDLRLGDIEQRIKSSENIQNQKIEYMQSRLNEYMNSFSKDVSKDIERIDMDFRNIKATIDIERQKNKDMIKDIQMARSDHRFQDLQCQLDQLQEQTVGTQQAVEYMENEIRLLSNKVNRLDIDKFKMIEQELCSMNKAIDRLIENQHSNVKQIYSHSEDIQYLNASLRQKQSIVKNTKKKKS